MAVPYRRSGARVAHAGQREDRSHRHTGAPMRATTRQARKPPSARSAQFEPAQKRVDRSCHRPARATNVIGRQPPYCIGTSPPAPEARSSACDGAEAPPPRESDDRSRRTVPRKVGPGPNQARPASSRCDVRTGRSHRGTRRAPLALERRTQSTSSCAATPADNTDDTRQPQLTRAPMSAKEQLGPPDCRSATAREQLLSKRTGTPSHMPYVPVRHHHDATPVGAHR